MTGDNGAAVLRPAASTANALTRSNKRQRGDVLLGAVGMLYVVGVAYWTFGFWKTLHEAAPVLDMFRAEHGPGKMTFDDWKQSGAVEIFCPHPGGDPSTNRIGRYINAGQIYAPLLVLLGLPTMLAGTLLGMLNSSRGGVYRWVARSIGIVMVAAMVVIVVYNGDIGALTEINE